MTYTREEMDWVEAEWVYHLHGRQAFLSGEDFRQLREWEEAAVPPELLVNAMEAFFQRRSKRGRRGAFLAMAHMARDVEKALKLRAALDRGGPGLGGGGWEGVREPLASDPRARAAHKAWSALKASAPPADAPGFLEHFDREREAFSALVACAEAALGPGAADLRNRLEARLQEAKLERGSSTWRRAWAHHWGRLVCEAWGIAP
ncbi:MAG: hypothetical protein HY823_06195 [Acidobacteria bacterium]|nr:hypothetical protein [Acidobacteriota bacterium]